MASMKVYHDPETTFREAKTREEALEAASRSLVVAAVKGRDLDLAFQLTNHIDKPWWENEGVIAVPGEHRSTSVGDFINLLDPENDVEIFYQIASFGFTEIDRYKFF